MEAALNIVAVRMTVKEMNIEPQAAVIIALHLEKHKKKLGQEGLIRYLLLERHTDRPMSQEIQTGMMPYCCTEDMYWAKEAKSKNSGCGWMRMHNLNRVE